MEELGLISNGIWLGGGRPVTNRKRDIPIRLGPEGLINEKLTRYFSDRRQHALILYPSFRRLVDELLPRPACHAVASRLLGHCTPKIPLLVDISSIYFSFYDCRELK